MANPFVTGIAENEEIESELDTFKEYAFDFAHDKFMYDENGKHIIVTENEALKVWIYKTLKTERWRYLAYENCYGIELEQFIGTKINNSTSSNEINIYIEEALLVNPYIKKIDKIEADFQKKNLHYNVTLTTIYGEMLISN